MMPNYSISKHWFRKKSASTAESWKQEGADLHAFADTADYLYANLAPELLATQTLHSAKVTGKGVPKSTLKKSYDFQELLTLFSPHSKEKAIVLPNEAARDRLVDRHRLYL